MKFCTECGKQIGHKAYPNCTCEGCYMYFLRGGTRNPIPPAGEITYDTRGFVVCHVCGRAYKRLGSHIKESHGMSIVEYKERYGLCNNAKTTEQTYSEKMSKHAYKNGMPQQLLRVGVNTRIKPGEVDRRKAKPVRLQECKDRSKRYLGKKKVSCDTEEVYTLR